MPGEVAAAGSLLLAAGCSPSGCQIHHCPAPDLPPTTVHLGIGGKTASLPPGVMTHVVVKAGVPTTITLSVDQPSNVNESNVSLVTQIDGHRAGATGPAARSTVLLQRTGVLRSTDSMSTIWTPATQDATRTFSLEFSENVGDARTFCLAASPPGRAARAGRHTSSELAELFGVARSTVYRAVGLAEPVGVALRSRQLRVHRRSGQEDDHQMGVVNRLVGIEPNPGETREVFTRRKNLQRGRYGGDMVMTLPALVDLYDELQALRARVEVLELKRSSRGRRFSAVIVS